MPSAACTIMAAATKTTLITTGPRLNSLMTLNRCRTATTQISGIHLPVLRNGLIFLKLALPLHPVERRHHARERLPLGDRQPGFRQPCGTANQDHEENKGGDGVKPQ